jgi:catechol 2,3-dioxygenase-like lactoylglutathione lyase family enzyme
MDDNPSILSHVSVGVADLGRAAAFYDAVLARLGARRVMEHPGVIADGRAFPEFWIGQPFDSGAPSPGNGAHVGFLARSRAEVDAFWEAALAHWEAALAHGGAGEGAPGGRITAPATTAASCATPTATRSRRIHPDARPGRGPVSGQA